MPSNKNSWNIFLRAHKNLGYSPVQLQRMYSTNKWSSRACIALREQFMRINMKEWKRGRFISSRQAAAVAYSQLRKVAPKCQSAIR